jgi:hypothetical protein
VPRKISKDGDMSGRRATRATAAKADADRGLLMRLLLHSPKDTTVGILAFAAVAAIVGNALFLQRGYHPAPMFGSVVVASGAASSNPLPRPRPPEAEPGVPEQRIAEARPTEKAAEVKPSDPVGSLLKASSTSSAPPANAVRPPAPVPISARNDTTSISGSRRVAAVQRALTEYGYGQLKPTGTAGSDTQAAIQKFERDRKLPVTGQVSERLVRELALMIGHPID